MTDILIAEDEKQKYIQIIISVTEHTRRKF